MKERIVSGRHRPPKAGLLGFLWLSSNEMFRLLDEFASECHDNRSCGTKLYIGPVGQIALKYLGSYLLAKLIKQAKFTVGYVLILDEKYDPNGRLTSGVSFKL